MNSTSTKRAADRRRAIIFRRCRRRCRRSRARFSSRLRASRSSWAGRSSTSAAAAFEHERVPGDQRRRRDSPTHRRRAGGRIGLGVGFFRKDAVKFRPAVRAHAPRDPRLPQNRQEAAFRAFATEVLSPSALPLRLARRSLRHWLGLAGRDASARLGLLRLVLPLPELVERAPARRGRKLFVVGSLE